MTVPEGQRGHPHDSGGKSPEREADNRQSRHHSAADAGPRPYRQDGGKGESPCDRTDHEETLASSNVAIDPSVATAARTTGNAIAAPVPSPSRIDRSTIGSSSNFSNASACAG